MLVTYKFQLSTIHSNACCFSSSVFAFQAETEATLLLFDERNDLEAKIKNAERQLCKARLTDLVRRTNCQTQQVKEWRAQLATTEIRGTGASSVEYLLEDIQNSICKYIRCAC